MNWLDILVISIILISGLISYQRGFIKTLFSFLSSIIALIITSQIYTYFSKFLMTHTQIHHSIKNSITKLMNLDPVNTQMTTPQQQISFINNMELPEYLKKLLLENNNSEVYNLLNVQYIGDYIGGLLATIAINIISFIIVFIVVSIGIKIIVNVLDLVSKLPILNQVNKLAGLIIGLALGVVIVWFVCMGASLLAANPKYVDILNAIEQSKVAIVFYENNLLMRLVTDISKTITSFKIN